jgi:DNA mismatch repair protein MutS
VQRLSLSRGGPRDLLAIRDTLHEASQLRRLLGAGAAAEPLRTLLAAVGDFGELCEHVARAIAPSPPPNAQDGGFVARGYSAELDRLRSLRDDGERLVVGLQTRYRTQTGIPSLKIRHNRILGYFIEVTARQAEQLAASAGFVKRQTLLDKHRFSTHDLAKFEKDIRDADAGALELEMQIFDRLCGDVFARTGAILEAARPRASAATSLWPTRADWRRLSTGASGF